jgi:tetratricopeptide (TPR) repeat protein
VLLFAALVAAYYPSLGGSVLWDDLGHITRPDLRGTAGLWRIWTEMGATQQYYPILHSAFWLEHHLWGDAPIGYRLANIAWHSLSAALLFLVLRRLSIPGALLAAFVWALHPVMVESVAWISEQKNTLSGVLYLAAAYFYVLFDDGRRRSHYWLSALLFACAVATKSVTATLPAAIVVVLWWRRGRLNWQRDAVPLLPWFAAGITAGLVTAWVEYHVIGARGTDFSLTILQRCVVAGRVFWFYIAKLIWPAGLTFIYPRWTITTDNWQQLFPAAAAIALGGLCLAVAGRTRAPLAAWMFFVVTLSPVLGFLNVYPFRFSFVADHFQYLASLALIVPMTAVIMLLAARAGPRFISQAAGVALAGVLGILTWHQAKLYADVETLWRATIERNPDSWLAYLNLGTELADQKRFREALDAFGNAARLNPTYGAATRDLAAAHLMLAASLADSSGSKEEAVAHYEEALRLEPSNERAHVGFGNLLTEMPGHTDRAIREYEAAIAIKPDYFRAHYNLGTVLLDIPDRHSEAVAHLDQAVRLEPSSAEAHLNLAVGLSDVPGRVPDAIRHLEAALAIKPDLAQARDLLGALKQP